MPTAPTPTSSTSPRRRRRAKAIPADVQALYEDLMSAITIDEYLDLKDPWLR